MGAQKPPHSEKSNEIPFLPRREPVKIKGSLLYNESAQAWNIIRLKKEVLNEFPELKEKRGSFQYTMIIPRSEKELDKTFIEQLKAQNIFPIFLSFSKLKENNSS